MTPLLHSIANELTLPTKRRTFGDKAGILNRLDDAHCFEVSQVLHLAYELERDFAAGDHSGLAVFGGLAFLPARNTWLEWREGSGRVGVMLQGVSGPDGRQHSAGIRFAYSDAERFGSAAETGILLLDGQVEAHGPKAIFAEPQFDEAIAWRLYAFLSMINSPRRIGQRVHMPHAGLQKKLARAHGSVGKYPLNAWKEITLSVAPPVDASNEAEWLDYLNNRMPLHFVRAHKRRVPDRTGPWVTIPAFWRGNAAFGIKLARYKLAA